jgi:hypothetical protein
MGNWYHFGAWASKSSAKIIDNSEFDDFNFYERSSFKFAEFFNYVDREEIASKFAVTNNLIALEMIPLGRQFLSLYCSGNSRASFDAFSQLLSEEKTQHGVFIKDAFYQYYLAINEENVKVRRERIALASTLQVLGEQLRVDDNLKSALNFNGNAPALKLLFNAKISDNGTLYIGNNKESTISLNHNMKTLKTHHDLLNVELDEYKQLLTSYDLPTNINEVSKYKKTKVNDWSDQSQRLRFLTAMFRTYIFEPELRTEPF